LAFIVGEPGSGATGGRSRRQVFAEHAFLATKIIFINEIADLCEKVGADVQDLARGNGLDNRIGSKFLHPGPGFGGSCFPKDSIAPIKTAHDYDISLRIVEVMVGVNDARKRAYERSQRLSEAACVARSSRFSA
jgi:UDPglucose 6-dehydrogenase